MELTFGVYSLLVYFLVSCGLCVALTFCVRDSAIARGIMNPPLLNRHVHTKPVPRLGGVAIYFSVVLVLMFAMLVSMWTGTPYPFRLRALASLMGPATIVFFLGVYDDLRGADPYLKLGVQACAGALLYWSGFGIQHFDFISSSDALRSALGLPLTVFWVLLITNAINLIDGLDGLAAGSALFSTIVIFVISLLRHNFFVSLITIVLAGAILGFLRFNFNPATIFLGDSGSLFVGFMLSALALAGSQKATTIVAVTIPVIAFGLPILDVTLAVARRLLSAKPLFDADNDHIHHKLLKRGLSHRAAVLILYGVTAGFGLLSMALLHGEKLLALVLVIIAIGVVFGIQQLRYVEFSELTAVLGRAVMRKRVVANNVRIRRAAELLDSCIDRETLCKILQDTLEPLGFSGFRWEELKDRPPEASINPMRYDSKGRIQFSWVKETTANPAWELRLNLTTRKGLQLGYLSLFQIHEDRRQLFDLGIMTDGVRTSISDALQRTIPISSAAGQASHLDQPKELAEDSALRRAASSD